MFWNLFKPKANAGDEPPGDSPAGPAAGSTGSNGPPGIKDPRHLLGASGEAEAARFLKAQGYKIITRNFKARFGEIDIIAKDRDVLVFVEVKTRSPNSLGTPEEAVTPRKIARITKAASEYMLKNERATRDLSVRFDVVGVTTDGDSIKCTLIKDAFPFKG